MSEDEFWSMTLRQIDILARKHAEQTKYADASIQQAQKNYERQMETLTVEEFARW
jgi:hypothetical protein